MVCVKSNSSFGFVGTLLQLKDGKACESKGNWKTETTKKENGGREGGKKEKVSDILCKCSRTRERFGGDFSEIKKESKCNA